MRTADPGSLYSLHSAFRIPQGYSEFEGAALSQSRARSGCAATSRVAAATLGWSPCRNRCTATFRSDAKARAPCPRRTRHRSSPNVSSRV
jgi:hypothetical protein